MDSGFQVDVSLIVTNKEKDMGFSDKIWGFLTFALLVSNCGLQIHVTQGILWCRRCCVDLSSNSRGAVKFFFISK